MSVQKRGFEYKSKLKVFGIPLIHICFIYGKYFIPKPAKGIISIGHFGIGVVNISQAGIGVFSLSQITVAVFAVAQAALAYSCIAQVALFFGHGEGQLEVNVKEVYQAYTCESNYIYEIPQKISDGLETGSLSEVKMKEEPLTKAAGDISCGRYKEVHSVLIYKDERLVFEEYFKGHRYKWEAPDHHGDFVQWDKDMIHDICSDAKSVTSALIGIAIDKGFIKSVDQSIFDYLPEHQHLKKGGKEKITIEHLLTMTTGLQWKEWSSEYSNMQNPTIEIWFQKKLDPVSYILSKPLLHEPGTRFNYSTGNMMVLGEIIRNATKMPIEEFSEKYLFKPLGITKFSWPLKYKNGVDGNTLKITPRDMIKIGRLYLNNGKWGEDQIFPESWIEKSSQAYSNNKGIDVPMEDSGLVDYGYTWWIKDYKKDVKTKMFYAGGFGGQHIMVFPEFKMVVVFTGANFVTFRPPFEIVRKYVFPALK